MADSLHNALTNSSSDGALHNLHLPGYSVANVAAMNAISTGSAGDLAYVQSSGSYYTYTGSAWLPLSSGYNSAIQWSAGTSMPGSPAVGQRVTRTDLNLDFFYDGTRWLTTQEYSAAWSTTLLPVALTGDSNILYHAVDSALDTYVTTAVWVTYVVTTNNGSNYWTLNVNKAPPTGAVTAIGTANTSADAANQYAVHTVAINATFDRASFPQITTSVIKTNSPGAIYPTTMVKYRLIGT